MNDCGSPKPNFVELCNQCLAQDDLCRKLETEFQVMEDDKANQTERKKLWAELEKARQKRCDLYEMLDQMNKPKAKKKETKGCVDNKGQN